MLILATTIQVYTKKKSTLNCRKKKRRKKKQKEEIKAANFWLKH